MVGPGLLDSFGDTQQRLLTLLHVHKEGLTADELGEALEISRTAVRQHLSSLGRSGLTEQGPSRKTGGRPGYVYVLTSRGRELFPRQYSWLADLLLEMLHEEKGEEGLRRFLDRLGRSVSAGLLPQVGHLEGDERIRQIAELMSQLGYQAALVEPEAPGGPARVQATNCVFHHLAEAHPEVCQFDLALLGRLAGDRAVEHQECIVRGGSVCRFAFRERDERP